MNTKAKQNGFTIIEVVLVLAIAALIFLMIFIAWPALQRTQRDTARKDDANKVASLVANYKSNHNGAYPAQTGTPNGATIIANLVKGGATGTGKLAQYDAQAATGSPATGISYVNPATGPITPASNGVIYVAAKAKCSPNKDSIVVSTNVRDAAVAIMLETGDTTCQDV